MFEEKHKKAPTRISILPSMVNLEGTRLSIQASVMPATAKVSPFAIGTATDKSVVERV
jgi:hypothetical protein